MGEPLNVKFVKLTK